MVDCTFIIFGITGDLSKRKLLPGLYKLIKDQKLKNFALVGVGLEEKSLDDIFEQTRGFIKDLDVNVFTELKSHSIYVRCDIKNLKDFDKLRKEIIDLESKFKLSGNRLFYCATPSTLFAPITKNLVQAGILRRTPSDFAKATPDAATDRLASRSLSEDWGELDSSSSVRTERAERVEVFWHRIAYEKPFGHNLKSAKKINREILSLIDESQIFRIDHYLAKEVVENILYTRFTNHIFESLWNNKHIDSVQIILSETLGLEGRGAYYDKFGALSDIVQNHLLQLLALITMDAPNKLKGDEIRSKKAEILKRVKVESGLLGQYKDYQQEPGVQKNSTTETFVLLKVFINDKRWKDIPFYLLTGKCLKTKETKINIQFKSVECKLTKDHCPLESNYLTIDLYPKGGFLFEINAKKPGVRDEVVPVVMDYCYECMLPSTPEAYENLLQDIIAGDQSISVRFDEIELSWKIIDAVKTMQLPLYYYDKNTYGPEELNEFSKKNNIHWR